MRPPTNNPFVSITEFPGNPLTDRLPCGKPVRFGRYLVGSGPLEARSMSRRGRPRANVDPAEVVRLRDEQLV
jgi:hypothetical protein